MIDKNIERLQHSGIPSLMNHSTVTKENKTMVCYLNLLVNISSGEILSLSLRPKCAENAISTPLVVKTTDLFHYALELSYQKEDLPSNIREVLEKSLEAFNKLSESDVSDR